MKRLKRLVPLIFLLAAAFLFAACGERGQGGGASQNAQQNAAQTPPAQNDVEFAREAFRLLAEGDGRVEEMIDWDNFVSFGDDFGAQYRKANDSGRAQARTDYVKSFSASLKEEGGAADKLANWREASKESGETVVAADMPSGARLLVTVAGAEGARRVSALAAEQPEGAEEEQK
ncbi:MAG TPA: hypothetical protein VFX96_12495 [Pyrinomonadaceae bacterium]|nr:hypothetical protein [Pyrinomonadaceae bacterium]